MEDQLINFETARQAKEKGFDEECWEYYIEKDFSDRCKTGDLMYKNREEDEPQRNSSKLDLDEFSASAPTQSLLKRWLREIHNIDVDVTRDSEIHYQDEIKWTVKVSNWNNIKTITTPIVEIKDPEHYYFIDFKSFEEAMDYGLFEALKLIK